MCDNVPYQSALVSGRDDERAEEVEEEEHLDRGRSQFGEVGLGYLEQSPDLEKVYCQYLKQSGNKIILPQIRPLTKSCTLSPCGSGRTM